LQYCCSASFKEVEKTCGECSFADRTTTRSLMDTARERPAARRAGSVAAENLEFSLVDLDASLDSRPLDQRPEEASGRVSDRAHSCAPKQLACPATSHPEEVRPSDHNLRTTIRNTHIHSEKPNGAVL
jgi:hypothetical protein